MRISRQEQLRRGAEIVLRHRHPNLSSLEIRAQSEAATQSPALSLAMAKHDRERQRLYLQKHRTEAKEL